MGSPLCRLEVRIGMENIRLASNDTFASEEAQSNASIL